MKSLKHYLLIIAISALPFISIFATPLMLHSHDAPMHLARMPAYYKALLEGQILPRWAAGFDYGYGTPLFNFYYHLPYLAASIPMSIGISLVMSFKLVLFASFLLSGISMFAFSNVFFKDIRKAYVATLLYQFAPFHLIDLVVRGDVGETLAIGFLPLVLFFVLRIFESTKSNKYIVMAGGSTALLILSHSAIGLIYFGLITLFILWFAPSGQKRIHALAALGLGLLLTTFFWLPVLAERRFTYGDLFMKDMYKSHFAPLWMFFVPNFTNSKNLQIGGIAVTFGLVQIIGILVSIWQFIKHKSKTPQKKSVIFCLALTILALCVMQPVSAFAWSHISILRAFQFPWRFLNVTIFSLAILGASVFVQKKSSRSYLVILLCIATFSTVVYWRPPLGFDLVNEQSLWNYPLNTTFFGETDVIWSAGMRGKYPNSQFEIIDGEGRIEAPVKLGTKHTFTTISTTPIRVVDNTQYFPGWRVFVDGKKTPIEFQDEKWRGIITFRMPSGTHHIQVIFGNSPVRQIAQYISITTIILLLVGSLYITVRPKHKS